MSNRGNKRNASAMSDSDDLDTNDGHYDHSVRGVPATPGGGMAYVTSSPDMGPQRDLPPSSPPPVATPFVASNIDGDDESDDETRRVLQAQYEEEDRALRMAQEAEEVEEEGEALAEDEEDEEGEDLFGPSMELDYLVNPEKDKYDEADIDDAEYEAMDPATRARVEARLRRRDLEQGLGAAKSRIPAAFLQGTF
ncbi:MCM DNA helicase complex subunit, partial [Spiromyces aspiralis]